MIKTKEEREYVKMIDKRLTASIFLILVTVTAICSSFLYVHWTAYHIAAYHIDDAAVVPPALMSLVALAVFVISVKQQSKRFLYKCLAVISLILLIIGIITASLSAHAYCPVCNYVDDDKWYPIFYKLFNGTSYEPI